MAASPRRGLTRWLRSATTLAAVASAAALGLAVPAHAATPNPMAHPERDYMGSTIRAHEHVVSGGVSPMIPSGLRGLDVSHWQGTINWTTVKNQGAQFAYIKATEGTSYRDPKFSANYTNAYYAGLVRGAYHFAQPASSSGAAQADYFAAHGGGWSRDNQTLPGMLDIEYNPNGSTCYGLSQASMRTLDHQLPERVPRQDQPLGDDLHHDGLVEDLHRQHQRVRRQRPAGHRPVLQHRRHAARGLGLLHLLAVRRLRHLPR